MTGVQIRGERPWRSIRARVLCSRDDLAELNVNSRNSFGENGTLGAPMSGLAPPVRLVAAPHPSLLPAKGGEKGRTVLVALSSPLAHRQIRQKGPDMNRANPRAERQG